MGYFPAKRDRRRSRHVARALIKQALRTHSWIHWVGLALDTLALVPVLRTPLDIASLSLLYLKGDYFEFALTLAGLACLPGIFGLVVKVVRTARKLWRAACYGVRVGRQAAALV